ncbi:hypothetical protein NEOLEDRAFT_962599 [Neolentinus lepideus HHB14362 ss-1]|uniref:Uncharacterized protein n=1 Tax=Neolentinus lepideus HHB14362 ss-1 TaxID=1314782 RepID=A0A165UH10_9AGAM|nr:hypothetical protein NEOLEDRAFT_962599 [Neolentinus lepideus HHB14362 ss-1]
MHDVLFCSLFHPTLANHHQHPHQSKINTMYKGNMILQCEDYDVKESSGRRYTEPINVYEESTGSSDRDIGLRICVERSLDISRALWLIQHLRRGVAG